MNLTKASNFSFPAKKLGCCRPYLKELKLKINSGAYQAETALSFVLWGGGKVSTKPIVLS